MLREVPEWHLSAGMGAKKKKRVLKFSLYFPLLLHSPEMNWLFRFKKVHGWNTKRGSSISPLNSGRKSCACVEGKRERERGGGGMWGCCWSLIRPWASSAAAQTSTLSSLSSPSNHLNHLSQFLHSKLLLFKTFFIKHASVCPWELIAVLVCDAKLHKSKLWASVMWQKRHPVCSSIIQNWAVRTADDEERRKTFWNGSTVCGDMSLSLKNRIEGEKVIKFKTPAILTLTQKEHNQLHTALHYRKLL